MIAEYMKKSKNLKKLIIKNITTSQNNFNNLKKIKNVKAIEDVSILIVTALRKGNKIMFCGNGGSAADAQHLSAELVGKYLKVRNPLPALCLTTNTSSITSIANDLNFSQVFSRQVRAFGKRGDVLFGITTSGKSENIIQACKIAKKKGINTVLLTSTKAKKMKNIIDVTISVPGQRVDRIQEMHITVGHIICEIVENNCG
tara:strand:+ start:880 stop:1482 length:603 start_codon:yes stop_codon:yes gene_type:complete